MFVWAEQAIEFKSPLSTHHSLIIPILIYGAESWTMSAADKSLGTFERKILRKFFGPICVNGGYRRRMNHELYELNNDMELAPHRGGRFRLFVPKLLKKKKIIIIDLLYFSDFVG